MEIKLSVSQGTLLVDDLVDITLSGDKSTVNKLVDVIERFAEANEWVIT